MRCAMLATLVAATALMASQASSEGDIRVIDGGNLAIGDERIRMMARVLFLSGIGTRIECLERVWRFPASRRRHGKNKTYYYQYYIGRTGSKSPASSAEEKISLPQLGIRQFEILEK